MQPFAVDVLLLREAAPDLRLTVGRALAARVLERGPAGVGILSLAGAIVTAELPAHVRPGDRLRLIVREATSERVLLQLAPAQPQPSAPPLAPPPAAVPLPGGGRVAALARDGGGGGARGERPAVVELRCELPALGRVDLRLALDAATVRAHVAVSPGAPLELAGGRARELEAALAAAATRRANVTVAPHTNPVDVYA